MNNMLMDHETLKINFYFLSQYSDWTSVERNVEMDHDLEITPLQIMSNADSGKGFYISLKVENIGLLKIEFGHRRFYIYPCGRYPFPSNLPIESNKLWTISRTKEALTILCNGVEVLHVVYVEVDMDCLSAWSKDSTKITFESQDDASDYIRSLSQGKFYLSASVSNKT